MRYEQGTSDLLSSGWKVGKTMIQPKCQVTFWAGWRVDLIFDNVTHVRRLLTKCLNIFINNVYKKKMSTKKYVKLMFI